MRQQNVKICKGAGCKAWSSDKIARELIEVNEGLGPEGIRICRVACMNVCGGGASVRVNSKNKIEKMKSIEDILEVLGVGMAELTA